MYFYIFDPGKDREVKYFERIQGRLLNLLAEAHVEGETYRVTSIRTVEHLVEQAIMLETKTIIVVGSDGTLNKAVNTLVRKKSDITLGYIPLDPGSSIAPIFGLDTDIEKSVKTLASRLIYEFDLGQVGAQYFITKIELGENYFSRMDTGFWGLSAMQSFMKLQPFLVKMSLEDSYTLTSEVLGAQIINCRNNQGSKIKLGDPTDQLLDILLLKKLSNTQIFRYRRELATGCLDNAPGATIMHARKIDILGPKKLPIAVEGQVYTKAPVTITVAEEKIKIIVGKNRQF